MRTYLEHRTRQFQIGNVIGIQLPGGHGQSGIHAITAAVGADGIALGGVSDGAYYRTADVRIGMSPGYGNGIDIEGVGMGGQVDVIDLGELGRGYAVVSVDARLLVGWRGDAHGVIILARISKKRVGMEDRDAMDACGRLLAFSFFYYERGEDGQAMQSVEKIPLPSIQSISRSEILVLFSCFVLFPTRDNDDYLRQFENSVPIQAHLPLAPKKKRYYDFCQIIAARYPVFLRNIKLNVPEGGGRSFSSSVIHDAFFHMGCIVW
jgi:hypothetical protein